MAHELDPAFAARAALILRHVQPAGAGRILDVGCGRGFYARAIAALYPQAAVVGVDYSNDYLTAAAENTRGMAVRLARADARSLPFASGAFDAIVCSEVLEHIVEDGAVLMELNRVLRDDGSLLISVPNRQYPFMWDPLNWVLERVFGTHVPAHIWWLAGIWADHVRLYIAPELSGRVAHFLCAQRDLHSKTCGSRPRAACLCPLLALWDRQEHHRTRILALLQPV